MFQNNEHIIAQNHMKVNRIEVYNIKKWYKSVVNCGVPLRKNQLTKNDSCGKIKTDVTRKRENADKGEKKWIKLLF